MKRFVLPLLVGLIALGAVLAFWAFWWEPARLVVRETTETLSCWNGPPIRIAVVSDLHIGSPYTGVEKLDRVVATINAGRPDMVVLLGDFVIQGVKGGRFVPPERIAEGLRNLRAPLGVYAVLGNHDWWLDASRVRRALESADIRVIEDDAVRVSNFWLAGISDFMEGAHDAQRAVAAIHDSQPAIAITHNPDVFPAVPARVCLTLAGHTHGGQVAIPGIGRPIVPSQYGERYAIGSIHEHGKRLFVTAGVGTSIIPVRFRVPPEIVFLTVERER
ncbi:MAG TPA: metallophosphoesterase [Thermoanaerobaculia bacterium]|nr:metallophosphoesterase [Thermoanaerobaculia bacterium]